MKDIISPIGEVMPKALTLTQLNDTYRLVYDIIDHLDEPAIKELMSGSEVDVNYIIDTLIDETAGIITAQNLLDHSSFQYLDRFTESIEHTLRIRSLNYFIQSVLPDFILGWHNLEWSNLLQLYRLLVVLAARDHGKSHHFSFAYPIWQMFRYCKSGTYLNKVPRELQMAKEGLLITNEFGLAGHLLAKIKEEIEANPILRETLMPDSKRDGWGAEKILCKNGSSFAIKSAGSKIRGYHPTYIVLDDFLNESSLYSQDQRNKYWNMFSGVILPALSPGGQLAVIGTPFAKKDMYGELKLTNIFKVFEYPAIFPDGKLLFPQRHSYKSLMEKKSVLGTLIFSREMLVQPISDDASLFPYTILRNAIKGQDTVDLTYNMTSATRKFVKIAIGADFSISSNIGADYSVFTVGGVDELGLFHVLNCWRKKGATASQQIAVLKKMNIDFEPDIIYVEDNGMQQIFLQMLEDAGLPVVGKTTTAHNKKSLYHGIPSLAALFETGRIKFPYGSEQAKNLTDLYFSELNSIAYLVDTGKLESVDQHDDTAMSLWQMVKGLKGVQDFDFSYI